MHAPLLVTRDTDLLDDLLRLAAAAGVTLDVAHDSGSALRSWSAAPLVLVGPDLAGALAIQAPPRRSDVFLLARSEPDYRSAVALGASDVVGLPAGETWLVEALADSGEAARTAVTVGFVGGSGGVGATSLACAVALTAAADRQVTLLDLDPLGPGVERVVGVDGGLTWGDLSASHGRLGSRALRDALAYKDGLAVLGYGASSRAVGPAAAREVLAATQRGNDLVVVDLPRHLSDTAAAIAARCDHVVLVASCSLPGAAAAARALAAFTACSPAVQLAARTTVGAVPASALAATLGLPLLAEVGHQRRLAEHVDLGLGPLHTRRGPLARAALDIVSVVAT